MKKFNTIFILGIVAILSYSCDNNSNTHVISLKNKNTIELIKMDTINRTDEKGMKQKHWIIQDYNTSGKSPIPIGSGDYLDNKKQGIWNYYDSSGKIIRTVFYKDDLPLGNKKN